MAKIKYAAHTTYLAFNGSIAIIPGVGTHFIDIETTAVRFKTDDLINNSASTEILLANQTIRLLNISSTNWIVV